MSERLFLKQAGAYSIARPEYPKELFFFCSLTAQHKLAWDVGTGNGQAAVAVSEHFDQVIATDVSSPQLSHGQKRPNISYVLTKPVLSDKDVEEIVGGEGSVDLVTVAQALHWFNLDIFYPQVKHVLRKPGGIFAAWCYQIPTVNPEVDAVLADFYRVSDPYWAPQRDLVDAKYTTLPFPFQPVLNDGMGVEGHPIHDFCSVQEKDLEEYLLYFKTWSAVQTALDQGVTLLTDQVIQSFADAWGDPKQRRPVTMPISLLVGKPN